ncbi:transcription initiation factor TFIID subunit 6-like, partial [Trifolium medium]|nr:transcription initiation factor TFIID subunit 6-like [Trifolium medium]
MLLETQKNEVKRHEAWRVYGALLRAAGQCIYLPLKMFPAFPSPAPHSVWKTSASVLTSPP